MKRLIIAIVLVCLCFAANCQYRHNVLYHGLEASYVVLNAADVITTFQIIDLGGEELNPILKPFIHSKPTIILVKSIVTFGSLLYLRHLRKEYQTASLITLAVLNVGIGIVVYHNYQVYLSLRI